MRRARGQREREREERERGWGTAGLGGGWGAAGERLGSGWGAAGIIKVAFCGTYRVGRQERLVNLTFGVEHRHHCGYAARSAFGAQTAVCGGAIDPGVPEL